MRLRIIVSLAIGLAAGYCCWFFQHHFHQNAADFNWALWEAQDLLAHRNPYAREMQLYPLPTAFVGLPLLWLKPEAAAGAFYGVSSALMAFGLSRSGFHGLLTFFAYPYWVALAAAQWSPLIFAAACFPLLLPATLVKPQTGLAVVLTYPSKRGYVACALVLLASLLIDPHWPRLWIANLYEYVRFIPLLVFPGPLLALALLRFRNRDARFLFLMSVMPQRWFYDALTLWLITESRREIIVTVGLSWIMGLWRWYHYPINDQQVGRWMVLCIYLPMLAIVLMRGRNSDLANDSERI